MPLANCKGKQTECYGPGCLQLLHRLCSAALRGKGPVLFKSEPEKVSTQHSRVPEGADCSVTSGRGWILAGQSENEHCSNTV